ncbi:P-loop containing nucleoside triphosphate hydrolase protein [Xylariaceae sp. FL1272]|nr:P-loop containing nucleoside triphosphate hydrolase protein [Xylariaceae sp. FL1272]
MADTSRSGSPIPVTVKGAMKKKGRRYSYVSDSDSEDEGPKKQIVGMICERKDLYQKFDKHGKTTWTEEFPDDLDEAVENEKTEKYALLVRNCKSYDSRKKLEIDSIMIQSPLLKKVLREVLKDYPGVTTSLARLIFKAPFKPFVHRWEQLNAAFTDDLDEDTKTHLTLLRDVLYDELKIVIASTEDYVKNKVVTYEHIWAMFQPGSLIYASRLGKPVIARLKDTDFTTHGGLGACFQVRCDGVDFDGGKFGYTTSSHYVTPFAGTMAITDLDCYPLIYHTDQEAVKEKLITRGRKFEALAGFHYKAYRGRAIETTMMGPSLTTIESRIIIDAAAYKKANPNQGLYLKALDKIKTKSSVQVEYSDDDSYDSVGSWSDDYRRGRGRGGNDDDFDLEGAGTKPKKRRALTEEELLLCTPVVRGYALRAKSWLEFYVDSINEIVFDDHAFDSLVLPENHKQLILAISESQVKNKDTFDDIIAGKGRGVIMLLSGGPGIGKTLTAESVAEHMRRPLYMMSASDLGADASEIESGLGRVLDMVAKWNAVLLLDECDVFLERRSTHDLDRNRIVSIFLRTLEYYEGILFLTTNRVKEMDEAFESRIHFRLAYPGLDQAARRKVWKGFLDRQKGHEVGEKELDRLSELDMNGRVIKNVLKSSSLLASHKGEKLGLKHLQSVLEIDGYQVGE